MPGSARALQLFSECTHAARRPELQSNRHCYPALLPCCAVPDLDKASSIGPAGGHHVSLLRPAAWDHIYQRLSDQNACAVLLKGRGDGGAQRPAGQPESRELAQRRSVPRVLAAVHAAPRLHTMPARQASSQAGNQLPFSSRPTQHNGSGCVLTPAPRITTPLLVILRGSDRRYRPAGRYTTPGTALAAARANCRAAVSSARPSPLAPKRRTSYLGGGVGRSASPSAAEKRGRGQHQ